MRELMREIQLKPPRRNTRSPSSPGRPAEHAGGQCLSENAGRTARQIRLILLSTEPQRILETILSRCLRLNFSGDGKRALECRAGRMAGKIRRAGRGRNKKACWAATACSTCCSKKLGEIRSRVDESLTARSPLKNTTRWKRICARNGRTNWPPPSRPNTAGSAPICCCWCNGGCATSGCTRWRRQRFAEFSRKWPARKPSPGAG
jgi:hypothetical protein